MRDIPNSACHPGGSLVKDESIVTDAAGHLANAIVYLKDGPPIDLPAEPVLIDQVGCRYVPHVVALRTGQTLRVRSSDATLHNVHGLTEINPPFNFGMSAAGQTRDVSFARPEVLKLRCDVHPWMQAYVAVFDHPMFGVTGADGTFEINHVPPGKYTLVAWQERLGEMTREITVEPAASAAAPVMADFAFGSGK
jgi:hypothetical protein